MAHPPHLQPVRVIQAPRPVPLATKVGNAIGAAVTIATAAAQGGPVTVPDAIYAQRLAACQACPQGLWNPAGNAGLGECQHAGCGCTKLKLTFAAMRCPLNPPQWEVHHGD